jgi:hypothetical protein
MNTLLKQYVTTALGVVLYALELQAHIWLGVGRRYQHQPELEARERAMRAASMLYKAKKGE